MFILTILLITTLASAEELRSFVKTGRYNPQLFGVSGRYMPDDRGKYRHIHVPYNGGYGDRGEKYIQDFKGRYWQQYGDNGAWEIPDSYEETAPYASARYNPSSLIPNYFPRNWHPGEHSYAQQYDYDTEGWRIIQFQWSKDGKTRYSYLYETEDRNLAEKIGKIAKLNEAASPAIVDGFYQFTSDDGTVFEVNYVANENGFYKGRNIQKSIQKVLDFLSKNVSKVPNQ